jgi:VWFA-related protein
MRYTFTLCLIFILVGGFGGPLFSSSSALAQSLAQEQSERDDSGPSLKKSPKKRASESRTEHRGEEEVGDVVRVDTTLVACDVLVLDKQGRFVPQLAQHDFVVTEDEKPQEVTTFALGNDIRRPRSIVLIIDYSRSMLAYINTSIEAAKVLVDKLNPEDRMAIVTDDVAVLVDFTRDKEKLESKLESLRKKATSGDHFGRSAQYSALMDTLQRLSLHEELRPIIIFQTDGDELPLLRQPAAADGPPPWPTNFKPPVRKDFSIADVFVSAEKSRATIYTVIPGIRFIGFTPSERLERARIMLEREVAARSQLRPQMAERWRAFLKEGIPPEMLERTGEMGLWLQTALMGVSRMTGGWADFLEKPEEAAAVYSRIFSDINERYIIGYQPTNKARDGTRRKVHIEVRGHPEYRVWGRNSYYAPSQ